ncbi:MAG: hypothetical protein U1D30_12030 [Planctomycetota bacterium]
MLEAGIYSILLKWGLDTITGIAKDKDPNHLGIVIEAIRTRNAIVLKRFEYAWSVVQEINDLLEKLEQDLLVIVEDKGSDTAGPRFKPFIDKLQSELHPRYYRKLRKIRNKLEATNDLFSAYSIEFHEMLRFDNVKQVLIAGPKKVSDAARTYRMLWETFSAVVATLVRVTSYDLRFWLTDVSYFRLAEEQAAADRKTIVDHFLKSKQTSWSLSIEDSQSVNLFWNKVIAASVRAGLEHE